MSRQAIGLIETVGLAVGIEAADAAIKSANVTLIGYELTKGGGMVTIKIAGDVGAVKAAVDSGVAAARRIGQVWSQLIIPRPHENLDALIKSRETMGVQGQPVEEKQPLVIEEKQPEEKKTEEEAPKEEKKLTVVEESPMDLQKIRELIGFETEERENEPTCNLCHDPDCPRQRGEPKVKCIHYNPENEQK